MIKIEAKNQIGRMISGSIIALPGIYNYRQVSTAKTAALSSGSSNRMDFLRGVQYFFLGVFPIFEISCYLIIFMRSSDIAFRKRNTAMIYICTAAAWFAYANLIFGLFGGIYCGIFHTFIILVQTLTVGPQLLRGITLWGMLEHNKFMLEYSETAKLRRMHLKSNLEEENNEQAIQEGESNSFTTDDEALTLKVDNEVQRRKGCAKEKARAARKKMQLLVKASKVILIGLPAILIITMFFVSNQGSMLKTDFDECFPEPGFILNIGRGFSIAFTIAAIASTVPVRHCNDGLGIRREIARNIAIIFITNVAIFATAYHKKYEIILILYIMQQIALSFSMIVMPYFLSSESPNPMLHYIKNMGKSAMPGYGRTLPNVHGGRSSLFVGINSRESIIDQKHQREMTMSLDAGLCILLSSPEGIKLFTEHCSREFSVENIRFWSDVNDFHKAVEILRAPTCEDKSEHGEGDIQEFANEIYKMYIKVGSELQINISSLQRKAVEKAINKSSRIELSTFDNAQNEVYALMSRHSYPRFLASRNQEEKSSLLKNATIKKTSMVKPSSN